MNALILALLISTSPPQIATGCSSGPNPPPPSTSNPNTNCTSSYDCVYNAAMDEWDCGNTYSTCEVDTWIASTWGFDCVCEGCDSQGNFLQWYCFDCQTGYNKHHNQIVKPKEGDTWTTVKKLYKD